MLGFQASDLKRPRAVDLTAGFRARGRLDALTMAQLPIYLLPAIGAPIDIRMGV